PNESIAYNSDVEDNGAYEWVHIPPQLTWKIGSRSWECFSVKTVVSFGLLVRDDHIEDSTPV
ncbi:hypothetical protein H0H93_008289, partial [Arthromyces matolae]